MAYKTAQDIITQAERYIYQSAGSAVQIYSEEILLEHLRQGFDLVFNKRYWPRFRERLTLTLDGVTGQTTVDPTPITSWRDVQYVYSDTGNDNIPILPDTVNTSSLGTGGSPLYLEPRNTTKLFRVWPLDATGTVQIVGRARPSEIELPDTVYFDDKLMAYYCAWSYFTDDESSPASAQKYQGLFEQALKQTEDGEFDQAVLLNTRAAVIPNRWS